MMLMLFLPKHVEDFGVAAWCADHSCAVNVYHGNVFNECNCFDGFVDFGVWLLQL